MKFALITDTHVGCRSGSSIFREYFRWFYENVLFKYMDENGIVDLLHGGDFFDNRNAISLQDIDFVGNWLASQLQARGYNVHIVLGNHDVAFRNTNAIHSLTILERAAPNNVTVYSEPTLVDFGGQKVAMIPWINANNQAATIEFINSVEDKENTLILGHFEIVGMKMYANSIRCEHGLEPIQFKDFEKVLSGHFHHMSSVGNILYMGSTFHLNWQDYGDPRGIHVYDTKTKTFDFVENEFSLFVQVAFDADIFKAMSDEEYLEAFEGRFVKLVVTDPDYDRVALLDTVSKINRCKPHDLQVQNDALIGVVTDADGNSAEEDTLEKTSRSTREYIASYIDDRYTENDPRYSILSNKLDELYLRANELLTKGE